LANSKTPIAPVNLADPTVTDAAMKKPASIVKPDSAMIWDFAKINAPQEKSASIKNVRIAQSVCVTYATTKTLKFAWNVVQTFSSIITLASRTALTISTPSPRNVKNAGQNAEDVWTIPSAHSVRTISSWRIRSVSTPASRDSWERMENARNALMTNATGVMPTILMSA